MLFAVVLMPSSSTMLRQSTLARDTGAAAHGHGTATSSDGSQVPMLVWGDEQQNPNYFGGGVEWGRQFGQQQPLQPSGALQTIGSSEPGVYYMPVQATVLQPFMMPSAPSSMGGVEGVSGLSPGYVTCEWPPCGDQAALTTPSPVRQFLGAPTTALPLLEPQLPTLMPNRELPSEFDINALTGLLRELDTGDATPEQALSDMLMRFDAPADAYPRLASLLLSSADSGCGIACVWHKALQTLGIEKKQKKRAAEEPSTGSLLCPNMSSNSSSSACFGNNTTEDVIEDEVNTDNVSTHNFTTDNVTTDNVTAANITVGDLPNNTVFAPPEDAPQGNSTTADCDVCASAFSVDGGCDAMKLGEDLAPFIPPGCGSCGEEAAALCIPVANFDNNTNESASAVNVSFYAQMSSLADALINIYPERADAIIDAERQAAMSAVAGGLG